MSLVINRHSPLVLNHLFPSPVLSHPFPNSDILFEFPFADDVTQVFPLVTHIFVVLYNNTNAYGCVLAIFIVLESLHTYISPPDRLCVDILVGLGRAVVHVTYVHMLHVNHSDKVPRLG